MSLSNEQVLIDASVEFQLETERGYSEAVARLDMESLVRRREAQTIDAGRNRTTLYYFEPDYQLDRFEGEVDFSSVPLKERSIVVDPFVKGIRANLHDLRDPERRAAYAERVRDLAANGAAYSAYRDGMGRLLNGDSDVFGLADDGQFFFDTDHPGADPDGTPTTYANLFALALSETNLNTVITAMLEYSNVFGVPMGNNVTWPQSVMPQSSREQSNPAFAASFFLHVGPSQWPLANELAAQLTASPGRFAGTFIPKMQPEMRGSFANHWIVQAISDTRKPLDMIDAGVALVSTDGRTTEPGRLHGRAEWVLWAAWGLQYNRWDCIAMSTGA